MFSSKENQTPILLPFKLNRLLAIGLTILFITSMLFVSGCSPKLKGPFDYADGVYEGASDLYD